MRTVLSALVPSHLMPMVPLAWALRAAGHEVLVIADEPVTATATAAGLTAVRLTPAEAPPEPDGPPPDPGTIRTAAYLPDWLRLARGWAADLVVTDPLDHAGWICAGALGLPLVVHRYGPEAFSTRLHERVREPLRPLAVAAGAVGGLPEPDLILDPCPPGLRSEALAPAHPVRFVPYGGGGEAPGWVLDRPAGGRRRVAVCLGVWGGARYAADLPQAFGHAFRALAAEPGLETVFPLPEEQRAAVGSLPGAVRAVDPLPLGLLAPGCDLIVHHGGAGTALTALAAGVPQLVLPPEQTPLRATAELVAAAGAGLAVPAESGGEGEVSRALGALLSEDRFAAAAAALGEEIRAQPSPADLVAVLERLLPARMV